MRTTLGKFVLVTAILGFTLGNSAVTFADAVLDQEHPAGPNRGIFVLDNQWIAQTFTAGITGILESIDTRLYDRAGTTSPLLIDIVSVTSGVPDSLASSLGSVSVLPSSVPSDSSFWSIDLSSQGISLMAGQVYAIVARSGETATIDGYLWQFSDASFDGVANYSGGAMLSSTNQGASWFSSSTQDAGFRTYVAPVPLPAAGWLLLSGSGALMALARRKRAITSSRQKR